jgi:hypothetical protein
VEVKTEGYGTVALSVHDKMLPKEKEKNYSNNSENIQENLQNSAAPPKLKKSYSHCEGMYDIINNPQHFTTKLSYTNKLSKYSTTKVSLQYK